MENSRECAAFKKCYSNILTAIQSPEHLADELYSQKVIDGEVKARVHLDRQIIMEKGRILLDAVEQAIKADPACFHVFCEALHQEGTSGVQTVCLKLKEAYNTASQDEGILYQEQA